MSDPTLRVSNEPVLADYIAKWSRENLVAHEQERSAREEYASDTIKWQRAEIARLRQREFVLAQNEETGRYWSGAREDIPPRFAEVPDRAEGGPLRNADVEAALNAQIVEHDELLSACGKERERLTRELKDSHDRERQLVQSVELRDREAEDRSQYVSHLEARLKAAGIEP